MYFDDVQIRLIILYALKSCKISMSEEMLQEVLVWNGILDYFTMMDFLLSMEKMEMVRTLTIEDKLCYDITPKGEEMVEIFSYEIPFSIRDTISEATDEILNRLGREHEIVADIVPIDHHKFLAKCGIYERNIPLLEVNLFAGSRKSAQSIAERFKAEAGKLYQIILEKIVE